MVGTLFGKSVSKQTIIGVDGKRRHIVRILLVSTIPPAEPLAEIEK